MTRLLMAASMCLVLLPAAALAQGATDDINADRPGLADGSTTVGAGRFQLETAIQRELRDNEAEHSRTIFAPTLLRYGLSQKLELRVEGNTFVSKREYAPDGGATDSHDFAPTSVGLKYAIRDDANKTRPSLGAIVRVFPPSGSGGEHTTHATGDFRLAADWQLTDKWSLNPNIGVGRYEDNSGETYAAGLLAATLGFAPSRAVGLFVDTGIQLPESKDGPSSVTIDAGGTYIIGHDIQLDLSIGTGVAGSTPPHPFLAAGFSKRF